MKTCAWGYVMNDALSPDSGRVDLHKNLSTKSSIDDVSQIMCRTGLHVNANIACGKLWAIEGLLRYDVTHE